MLFNVLFMVIFPSTDNVFQSAESVRKELHFVLSQMLLGDSVAADYMICHLISLV